MRHNSAVARQPSLFTRTQLAQPRRRGRPPKAGARSHVARPPVDPRRPHHVTVRVRRGVWNLRSQRCFPLVAGALRHMRDREGFRVVHFSVQGNHLHLVTEADDRVAMANGMRALLIRIAKRLNSLMGTSGRLYRDRYHERILASPREVTSVIKYVLGNYGVHLARAGVTPRGEIDACSSAALPELACAPGSWLLRVGWKRAPRASASAIDP
jgi:putative transposase